MNIRSFAFLSGIGAVLAASSVFAVQDDKPALKPGPKLPHYVLLKPVVYKNLTVFPVTSGGELDQKSLAGRYITLDEGLKSGEVEVREMGVTEEGVPLERTRPGARSGYVSQQVNQSSGAEVNRLALYNRSGKHLLLLAGEMVVGGRQDRIVQKDTLVPPSKEPLPLAVFCVEHGRWTAQTEKFGNQIGGGGGFGGGLADPGIRGTAQSKNDQGAVWGAVAGRNNGFGTENSTGTYQATLASPKVRKDAEDYMAAIQAKFPKEGIVGAVVAVNGKLVWADVFSGQTRFFQSYWPKLLRSYAIDALSTPPVATGYDRELWQQPSIEQATKFLEDRSGRSSFEGTEDVYKLRRTESASHVIYDIEDIGLGSPILLHTCKMKKEHEVQPTNWNNQGGLNGGFGGGGLRRGGTGGGLNGGGQMSRLSR